MVVKKVFHTRLRWQGQWQPQRAVPQQERFEAQPQPQLVGQRLEFQLPLPCGSQLLLTLLGLFLRSFILKLAFPSS